MNANFADWWNISFSLENRREGTMCLSLASEKIVVLRIFRATIIVYVCVMTVCITITQLQNRIYFMRCHYIFFFDGNADLYEYVSAW